MLKLTPEEQQWLDTYRKILDEQFPDLVEDIIIFGSKARGTATDDSDVDILLIIKEGDWQKKRTITHPGYMSSIETDVVPSFIVLTVDEWELHRKREAPFWRTVTRDGVTVG